MLVGLDRVVSVLKLSVEEGEYKREHMANMAARPAAISVPGLQGMSTGADPMSRATHCVEFRGYEGLGVGIF